MIALLAWLHGLLFRWLAPIDLRREYGAQIEVLFREILNDAAAMGGRQLIRVWIREVVQLPSLVRPLSSRRAVDTASLAGLRRRAETGLADVRLAAVSLIRRPLLSVGVALTLTVGLGLTAAVYAVASVSVLSPIPVPDPGRVLVVTGSVASAEWSGRTGLSALEVEDFADHVTEFEDFALFSLGGNATLIGGDRAVLLRVSFVSPSYFEVLRAPAALGRTFRVTRDDRDGASVVLAHHTWMNRFGGDPAVVGRDVELAGARYEVIGVMPEDHWGVGRPRGVDAWLPLSASPGVLGHGVLTSLGPSPYWGVGRLADGASSESAQAELEAVHGAFAQANPLPTQRTVAVMTLDEYFFGTSQKPLLAVSAGAGLVLLISSLNLFFLIGLRARERRHELAVRRALGGSRGRLVQAVLAEAWLLALVGAVGAVVLGRIAVGLLARRFEPTLLHFADAEINGTLVASVVVGAFLLTTVAALATSSATPPTRSAGPPGPRLPRGTRRSVRAEWAIGIETGLAVLVLLALTMSARSLRELRAVDVGYVADGLMGARVALAGSGYEGFEGSVRFARALEARLSARPGVTLGVMGPDMMGRSVTHVTLVPSHLDPAVPENRSRAQWISLSPRTFEALGMEILEGRDVSWSDGPGARGVALLSEDAARRFWPGESAVGKLISVNGNPRATTEVVGVVRKARHLSRYARPYVVGDVYFPLRQRPTEELSILYRSSADAPLSLGEVFSEIASIDSRIAPYSAGPMTALLEQEESGLRIVLGLSGLYSMIAVFLVLCGMVTLIGTAVHERRGELAIRAAIGARRTALVWTLIRGTMTSMMVGLLAGSGMAATAMRPLGGILFGVSPSDPISYAVVVAVVLGLSLVAASIAVSRVISIGPAEAMRSV